MSKLKDINSKLDLYMKGVINEYLDENGVNEIRMYKLRNDWGSLNYLNRKLFDNLYYNDMEIVDSVFDEDGIYGIEYGSRGEVEFVKVNNFVKDIIEFVKVSNKENEFRWIVENDDYLDLNFEEELSLSYFIIREV